MAQFSVLNWEINQSICSTMSNKRVKCLRVSEHCFGKMVHIEGTRRVQAEFDLSDNVTKIEISKTFFSLRKCHFWLTSTFLQSPENFLSQ